MAQKLSVVIVGDAASAKAAFAETGAGAEGMAAEIGLSADAVKGAFVSMLKSFAPLIAAFSVADFLKGAITGAESLKKAQDGLAVAIEHTGGNVGKLMPEYTATAKAAADFGVTQVSAMQGLERATLLSGNAASAQRAYQEALVISKATGLDFNSVLTATAKGQEGITTSLKRYGIEVAKGATGQQQFTQVMQRFGGQAQANTAPIDVLRAHLSNLSTDIGTVLLPAFNDIVTGMNSAIMWVQANWPQIEAAITPTMNNIRDIIEGVLTGLQAFWKSWGGTVTTIVKNSIAEVKQEIEGIVSIIKGVIEIVDGLIHGRWSQVWQGMKDVVTGAFQWLLAYPEMLLKDLAVVFQKVGDGIMSAIAAGMHAAADAVKAAIDTLIIQPINSLILELDALKLPKVNLPFGLGSFGGGSIFPNIPTIPLLDSGGLITRSGLAEVSRGEVYSGVGPSARGFGPNVTVNMTVHGTADAAFARVLATELATQLRGGRAPALAAAIGSLP